MINSMKCSKPYKSTLLLCDNWRQREQLYMPFSNNDHLGYRNFSSRKERSGRRKYPMLIKTRN